MDSFDKLKLDLDQALERARAKVQGSVESSHADHINHIKTGARERLVALKNKNRAIGSTSQVPTRITPGSDSPTVVGRGQDSPTQRAESVESPTIIGPDAGAATQLNTVIGSSIYELSPVQCHQIDHAYQRLMGDIVEDVFEDLKMAAGDLTDEASLSAALQRAVDAINEVFVFLSLPIAGDRSIESFFGASTDLLRAHLEALSVDSEPATIAEKADAIRGGLDQLGAVLNNARCEVDTLIRRAVERHSDVTTPVIEFEGSVSVSIFTNEERLVDAFSEIIGNAIRHADAKRVVINATTDADAEMLEITFRDDGKGMSAEAIGRCLDLESASGSGFAGVLECIEIEHLGSIQISTLPESGVLATVLLPISFPYGAMH